MSLVPCKTCGKIILADAHVCPRCGMPTRAGMPTSAEPRDRVTLIVAIGTLACMIALWLLAIL
jgi:rRNA maturation protein Nop10